VTVGVIIGILDGVAVETGVPEPVATGVSVGITAGVIIATGVGVGWGERSFAPKIYATTAKTAISASTIAITIKGELFLGFSGTGMFCSTVVAGGTAGTSSTGSTGGIGG